MDRRSLLKAFTGALAVFGTRVSVAACGNRYGPMTIERHLLLQHQGIHLRMYHQGHDVTSRCYYADDTGEGMAGLFRLDHMGRCCLDSQTKDAVKETVYGVTFMEGPPFKHNRQKNGISDGVEVEFRL